MTRRETLLIRCSINPATHAGGPTLLSGHRRAIAARDRRAFLPPVTLLSRKHIIPRRSRFAGFFGAAFGAFACATSLAPLSTRAAVVEGRAIVVTREDAPLADAEVRLVSLSDSTRRTQTASRTNANGAFRFARVASGPGAFYRLETTYAGLRQATEPFPVDRDRVSRDFAVHDTTSSPAGITVGKVHLIASPGANGVGITSIFIVENGGGIFIGDPPTAQDPRRTGVRFLLPADATDFQVLEGVLAAHHKVTPWGFASTIPFYPGSDTLVYSYVIPWQGSRASFDIESPYDIASLSVIAMPGTAELAVEGGERRPSQMGMGANQQLVNIERSDVPANTPVRVDVLPPSSAGAGGTEPLSVGQWLVIVASAAMVAVILFAVYVRRKQSRRDEEQPVAGEPEQGEGTTSEPQTTGVARSALVDALVAQIADLDEAYEKGQIGEADYVSRRRALKADLVKAVKAE